MPRKKITKKGKKGGVAMQRQGIHPVAAGVMGAVAGAAVGATAAIALSDEKTRKKIGDVVQNISKNAPIMADKVSQQMQQLQDKTSDMVSKASNRLNDTSLKKNIRAKKIKK